MKPRFLANRRSSVLQEGKIRIWHKAGLPIRFRGSWTADFPSRARPSRNASTRASNSKSFGSSSAAFGKFLCNGESYIPYRSLSVGPHRRQIIAAVDLLSMVALRTRLEGHASRRLTRREAVFDAMNEKFRKGGPIQPSCKLSTPVPIATRGPFDGGVRLRRVHMEFLCELEVRRASLADESLFEQIPKGAEETNSQMRCCTVGETSKMRSPVLMACLGLPCGLRQLEHSGSTTICETFVLCLESVLQTGIRNIGLSGGRRRYFAGLTCLLLLSEGLHANRSIRLGGLICRAP